VAGTSRSSTTYAGRPYMDDNWKVRGDTAPTSKQAPDRLRSMSQCVRHSDWADATGAGYRHDLRVRGWLVGHYWEQKGPQHFLPPPDGILNPRGGSTHCYRSVEQGPR